MNTDSISQKRGWTEQEDQIILQMVPANHSSKFKWVQVTKVLLQKLGRQRTGKQCRQRWQHQLNPNIIRQQWTQSEQFRLFQLQTEYGNRWSLIAENLPGRTDNAVKNFFYSAVRKVFTKINMFLAKNKNRKQFKNIREFEADFLTKLMAGVDSSSNKKIRLNSNDAALLAKQILHNITALSISHDQSEEGDQNFITMIKNMHEFRKSCKKRKQTNKEYQKGSAGMEIEDIPCKQMSIENHSNMEGRDQQDFQQQMKENQQQWPECHILQQMKSCINKQSSTVQIMTSTNIQLCDTQAQVMGSDESIREDKWWGILEGRSRISHFKMEEDSMGGWEWRSDQIFPLDFQREDFLSSSQEIGQNQIVTNFQMLEASIALEELRLNTNNSSREEQYQQPSRLGLGI